MEEIGSADSAKLYKTELCRSWEETGACRYGNKCQFAHGKNELRPVNRHPKYKTEMCRTFSANGTCPYGRRCRFIHAPLKIPDPKALERQNLARLLNETANSPRSRLAVFRRICPGPPLVY